MPATKGHGRVALRSRSLPLATKRPTSARTRRPMVDNMQASSGLRRSADPVLRTQKSSMIMGRRKRVASTPRVEARTVVFRVAIRATEPRQVSLVSATPLSGRLHQIRRHLKHANHPVIGDGRYGRGELNRAFRDRYQLERLALHAYSWCVRRPGSERVTRGIVPLPSDLSEPLMRMGFDLDAKVLPVGLLPADIDP
jgi:hypothetical protein